MLASRRLSSTGDASDRDRRSDGRHAGDPRRERRVGRDAGRLGVGRLPVEVGRREVVERVGLEGVVGVGHGADPVGGATFARGVGRSGGSLWFRGPMRRASWARPRAMRERTVPGGRSSTSAISA